MSNARKVADLGGSGTLPVSQVSGLGSLATKSTVAAGTDVTGLGALATKSSVATADLADGAVTTVKVGDLQVTPAKQSQKLTQGTSVATTSGTAVDFTGIPSWVKRITVMFNGVSVTSASVMPLVQLGTSSGPTTSGYMNISCVVAASVAAYSSTSGFVVQAGNASYALSGALVLTNLTGNTWCCEGSFGNPNVAVFITTTAGSVSLGAALDRVRITTTTGTDNFDAGSVNILYE